MKAKDILNKVDHTLLSQWATKDDIFHLCDDAALYGAASVCIPPCYISDACEYIKTKGYTVPVCTVIGFPNGNMTTESKVFETIDAINKGADEIDMVINIGRLKAGEDAYVSSEVAAIKKACGEHILKVIIETCYLTEEEKVKMCKIVTDAGAEFIKTSTGFGTGGATFEDVELFSRNIGSNVRIKAAGGIKSLDDAVKFISLGASRLGTSRIIKICKSEGISPDDEI